MKYFDYDWDLNPDGILFDEELNLDKLGWEDGDYFKFVDINGRKQIVKVDPIELFSKGVKINGA